MSLNNIIKKPLLTAAALSVLLLGSCNEMDKEDRLEYVKPAQVSRAVLIEDFTGQKCVNCPNATDEIHALQEQYGDSAVIAVGIHSGPLGFKGSTRLVGLATDLGDTYYNYWGADHQPVGLVNRSGGLQDYPTWAGLVRQALSETAPLDLSLQCNYNAESRELTVETTAYGTNGTTNGKLQVWLVEDSITAMQMMPDGSTNRDYVHNHVLRASMNGDWGEDITVSEGSTTSTGCSITLDEKWVPTHVSVIAFVYNNSGVQQVVKQSILKTETEE